MNNPLYFTSPTYCSRKSIYFEKKGNYYIVIATDGKYPDAFVSVPSTHPLKEIRPNDCRIFCHGGIRTTITDYILKKANLLPSNFVIENCIFISWSYNMVDDYITGFKNISSDKEWTIQEIVDECYDVIDQLEKLKS